MIQAIIMLTLNIKISATLKAHDNNRSTLSHNPTLEELRTCRDNFFQGTAFFSD